tara:strand:+ start:158 stop:688 length:531 start_codon:yes stop_codon:yes gene_type:complete
MIFEKLKLEGAYLIHLKPIKDERGLFARSFCKKLFTENNLETNFVQSNFSMNYKKATLRGMHQQLEPDGEIKLVRCTQGKIFDVIVDYREDSKTYLQWFGAELTDENHTMMYVPKGFFHGYLTLTELSSVFYMVSNEYTPSSEIGIRYDDSIVGIEWPLEIKELSEKDSNWPIVKK